MEQRIKHRDCRIHYAGSDARGEYPRRSGKGLGEVFACLVTNQRRECNDMGLTSGALENNRVSAVFGKGSVMVRG